jgi:hypothetical protein
MGGDDRKEPLRCGSDLLGYVTVTDVDMFWQLGEFSPGPDYAAYRPLFEELAKLSRCVEEESDENYVAASDAWLEALERINRVDLRLGEPGRRVRDLKIDDERHVEFKEW